MLKKHTVIFILLLQLLACKNNIQNTNSKPTLCVSILPQKYFVEKIAGDKFNIEVLIPEGLSPAIYEPTPKQIFSLSQAKYYFTVGHLPFENMWMDKIIGANPQIKVFKNSQGILFLEEKNDQHHHLNPHVWLSPRNVQIMAKNITNILIELQPENRTLFEKNYNIFLAELKALDYKLSNRLSVLINKKFIILHPFLSYFARDYGLTEIPFEIDGKETTLASIQNIIDRAREENVRLVLIQQQLPQHYTRVITKEIEGTIVFFDPLAYNWIENIEHLLGIFEGKVLN